MRLRVRRDARRGVHERGELRADTHTAMAHYGRGVNGGSTRGRSVIWAFMMASRTLRLLVVMTRRYAPLRLDQGNAGPSQPVAPRIEHEDRR